MSKPQRRADMYVSTLQSFVKAMGGELKITARFPEGTVDMNQFEDVKKAAGGVGTVVPPLVYFARRNRRGLAQNGANEQGRRRPDIYGQDRLDCYS